MNIFYKNYLEKLVVITLPLDSALPMAKTLAKPPIEILK